jgi:hypothetical protein
MDEVGADEELRAAVCESADGVGVPDFLEEAFSHGKEDRRGWRRTGILHGRPWIVKAACRESGRKIAPGSDDFSAVR